METAHVLFLLLPVFSAAGQSRFRTFHIIGNDDLSHAEALALCRRNYTDLVTVYSEEDNDVLVNLMGKHDTAWIGLIRRLPSYKWSNGDAVTFKNLNSDCSPNFCANMKAGDKWDCTSCTEKRHFMCYKQGTGHSYYLVLEKMSWYDAQRYCRKNYTDLVSIRDQEQNEEVKLKGGSSAEPFWIGLVHDEWEWDDGGLSAYRNWGTKDRPSSPCVNLKKDGWYQVPCSNVESALCYSTTIHVSNDSMSWESALDYCKEDNRTGLLRIESDLDQKEVETELRRNNVTGPVWVGLRQSRLFGFWIWSNGMAVGPWTNWKGETQPEHLVSHHCGAIETQEHSYKWRDKDCRFEFKVLCEEK